MKAYYPDKFRDKLQQGVSGNHEALVKVDFPSTSRFHDIFGFAFMSKNRVMTSYLVGKMFRHRSKSAEKSKDKQISNKHT